MKTVGAWRWYRSGAFWVHQSTYQPARVRISQPPSPFRGSYSPTPNDWKALKLLLRYLNRPFRSGIVFSQHADDTGLVSYIDADWGRDKSARRSHTGVAIVYTVAPVVWMSKQHIATAPLTSEAEFAALSNRAKSMGLVCDVLCKLRLS